MSRKILVTGGRHPVMALARALVKEHWLAPAIRQQPPFWSADFRNKRGKR